MIIAISYELNNMKEELENKGHTVVELGKYNYPIDAILYYDKIPMDSYICFKDNIYDKNKKNMIDKSSNNSLSTNQDYSSSNLTSNDLLKNEVSTQKISNDITETRNNYGVFMVPCKNKTTDEIINILNNRCYSPLF